MRAGRIARNSITIQQPVVGAVDDYGGPSITWAIFVERRAGKEPVSGYEQMKYQQEQTISKVRFRLRYVPGVTTAMRVLSDGLYYDITHIHDPENRHKELVLTTEEKSYANG